MSVSAGIVGLPNVGKSTIFNALTTGKKAESANYPFCTIDKNVGMVPVPDPRLAVIHKHITTDVVLPAVVDIVDIAGLVKGASKGEGLGNRFLGNIRETDAILHVVRCFADPNITHVEGSVDPRRDVDIIEMELMIADLGTLEKRLDKSRRAAKSGDKTEAARRDALEKAYNAINDGRPARLVDFTDADLPFIYESHLLTMKPVLYVGNVGEDDLEGNSEYVAQLRELAVERNASVVLVCGSIEAELAELDPADRDEMLEGLGIAEPALNVLVRATYALLGLQSYFTAGEKEIRAWTIPVGATAPQAAAVIHSDFEKHFIRAEVFTVESLNEYGDVASIRAAGKLRLEGRDYVVADGDIMHFRTSA